MGPDDLKMLEGQTFHDESKECNHSRAYGQEIQEEPREKGSSGKPQEPSGTFEER
jgi:hypothetical protein